MKEEKKNRNFQLFSVSKFFLTTLQCKLVIHHHQISLPANLTAARVMHTNKLAFKLKSSSQEIFTFLIVSQRCRFLSPALSPCHQGLTVEDVCKQLRRLYVVKNFSLEHSVSITCDPSFSASNEIHVCIVSALLLRHCQCTGNKKIYS